MAEDGAPQPEQGAPAPQGPASFSLTGMKLSSSRAKRPKLDIQGQQQAEQRQLITGVGAQGIVAAEPEAAAAARQFVVPALQNTYRTGLKRFTPSFKPPTGDVRDIGSTEDRFEAAAAPVAPAVPQIYGLETRGPKAASSTAAAHGSEANGSAANGSAATGSAINGSPANGSAANGAGASGSGPAAGNGAGPSSAAFASSRGGRAGMDAEQQLLREDLEALPDTATDEQYEDMPVEEFGKALLRGLGWLDGQGVGRKRQLVQPTQIVRRPERLGLGADPAKAVPEANPRPRKMGDKPKEQDMVLPPDADGRQRHLRTLDEQLVPRGQLVAGPAVGKKMRVVEGRHAGLVCEVLEMLPVQEGRSARALVRLHPSGEEVEVRCKELADRTAAKPPAGTPPKPQRTPPPPPAAAAAAGAAAEADRGERPDRHRPQDEGGSGRGRGSRGGRDSGRDSGRGSSRDRDGDRHSRRDREGADGRDSRDGRDSKDGRGSSKGSKRSRERSPDDDPHASGGFGRLKPKDVWLHPHVRVRILDKQVGKGRLYLKKAIIVDVHPGGICDVSVEETKEVLQLPQQQLETVVPKEPGAALLVVFGEFKGQRAKLLQASKEAGVAAVQLAGDYSVQRVLLDDVAQFMGSLDEDEH